MMNFLRPTSDSLDSSQFHWRYVLLIFLVTMAWLGLFGYHGSIPFIFDADTYWALASHFIKGGHFSLLNFDSNLRGYLLPLLLVVPRAIVYFGKVPQSLMIISLGALQAALLFGWVLPALYGALRRTSEFSGWRRLLFAAIGLCFWVGYFNYTLSDFPALLAYCGALALLLSGRPVAWKALVVGMLLGAALNMRPFFLIGIPVVLLLVITRASGPRKWGPNLRTTLLVGIGMCIALWPQWHINRNNFGENSPLVLAKLDNNNKSDLTLLQFGWGMKMQKIETAFGSAPDGRNALVIYRDRMGEQLLKDAGYPPVGLHDEVFHNLSDYFSLLLHHPITSAGVYLAHLFNGLDQHFNSPYIREPIQDFTVLLPFINYSLWFGFLLLLWQRKKEIAAATSGQILVLLSLLLPCVIGCIVATETRFLLPLHMLIYAVVCFDSRLTSFNWSQQRLRGVVVMSLWVLFLAACFSFSLYVIRQQTFTFV